MKTNVNTGLYVSSGSAVVVLVSSANPFVPLALADSTQTLSSLSLVNKKSALGMD